MILAEAFFLTAVISKVKLQCYLRVIVCECFWGCSSVGRAREWHSRGHGFEPRQLHKCHIIYTQEPKQENIIQVTQKM